MLWQELKDVKEINNDQRELHNNAVFNHNFIYPGISGQFPAGWQKYKGGKTSSIDWEKDNDAFNIRIKNKSCQLASISQQRSYCIPVYKEQVWKLAAIFKVEKKVLAIIIVHFISSSARVIQTSLEFILEPETEYYYGIVNIPSGIDHVFLEVGIKEAGTLWVEEVIFTRIFPTSAYNIDNRGRFNINSVESINNILEPVVVQRIVEPVLWHGNIEAIKQTVNLVENVVAGPTFKNTTIQDVFQLSEYTFFVINQGQENVKVYLQMSPDGMNWTDEPANDSRIEAGKTRVLVSSYFLRYIRLGYVSEHDGFSQLRIYFQGQG